MKRKSLNIQKAGKSSGEKKDKDEWNRDREDISYETAVKGGESDYHNNSSGKSDSNTEKTFKDESQYEGQYEINTKYKTSPKTYANAAKCDIPDYHSSHKVSNSKVTSYPSVKLEKLNYAAAVRGEYLTFLCE